MKLSVIIVNYNVEYFLEQCLHAVRKALSGIEGEVFVVDNNSVDGSEAMVKDKFPEVIFIANKKNHGFSKANNQAIQLSKGQYVLLLNPDTVVEEDTFSKVIAFMDAHPEAGGLGVKMIDGKGNFLPESKRGLPTPAVAFYKIIGLSRLFPKSRTFGRYHLGFLDKDATNEVDVLAGAFMLLRKETLDKVGLLDEDFFMYGEDIDLSYRILKGGYKNYYFPETRIIHYKGESTKKSSVNYVFVFYQAMVIFARKHFSKENARLFSFLIHFAIYLRAGVAILNRLIKRLSLPLLDAAVLFTGIFALKEYYEGHFKYREGGAFPETFIQYVVPGYILIWLLSVLFSGGYDKPVRLVSILRGLLAGTGIILVIYALLPETLRFSRILVLVFAAWALISMLTLRLIFHFLGIPSMRLAGTDSKRIVIVGGLAECERVNELLKQTSIKAAFTGYVSIDQEKGKAFIGTLEQLKEVCEIYKVDEVIFCARDMSAQMIIDQMTSPAASFTDFKIAPPESLSVIGSNSIDTSGDLYVIDTNSVTKPSNRRSKRLLDITMSLVFIAFLPVFLLLARNPFGLIVNILKVLFGQKTWVGFDSSGPAPTGLPSIRKGVLDPTGLLPGKVITNDQARQLNILYAKDYRLSNDIRIIFKGLRNLGR